MSDNLNVLDGANVTQYIRATDDGGIKTPHHILAALEGGVPVPASAANPIPVTLPRSGVSAFGDFITAEQALDKGLVNAVVVPEQLDAEVHRYVDSILAKPRTAVAIGKKLFYEQLEQPLEAAYQNAEHAMACNMMEDAALEGVQAFIDKRAPSWKTS